jgi:hypothetical protein
LRWWWALHAIHHSQRQMTLWTDSRNHLLDDLIGGFWFAVVALLIGVPPGHFIGLLIVVKTVENLVACQCPAFVRTPWRIAAGQPALPSLAPCARPAGRPPVPLRLQFRGPLSDLGSTLRTQYRGQAMPACGLRHGPLPEPAAQSGFWRQQKPEPSR